MTAAQVMEHLKDRKMQVIGSFDNKGIFESVFGGTEKFGRQFHSVLNKRYNKKVSADRNFKKIILV